MNLLLLLSNFICKKIHLSFILLLIVSGLLFFLIYVQVFCLHVCLWYHIVLGVWGDQKRCVRFPGTEVSDSCKPLCGCCDWKLGPLGKKPVLLPLNSILLALKSVWLSFLFLHLHYLNSNYLEIAGFLND